MYTVIPEKGVVVRNTDGVVISPCQSYTDEAYVEYTTWVLAGNTPSIQHYEAPIVPTSVTPRQIRLALNILGIRNTVEEAVSVASQDIKDTWNYSTEIDRNNPLIAGMANTLGLAEAQVDSLFILASGL
jgi:hypothetical protein